MNTIVIALLHSLAFVSPEAASADSFEPTSTDLDKDEGGMCVPGPKAIAVLGTDREELDFHVCHKDDPNDTFWTCIEWICPNGTNNVCYVGTVMACSDPYCMDD